MNLVFDTIVKKETDVLTKAIKTVSTEKVITILNRDVTIYDFKKDTENLVQNLSMIKQLGSKYLKTLALINYKIPEMIPSVHIDINQKFNNMLYMTLLRKYMQKNDSSSVSIPLSDKEFTSEKNHAFNSYKMLEVLDVNKVRYEHKGVPNQTRNLLVKASLAHQGHCFVTGEKLTTDNSSIDHLVPLDSKYQTSLIKSKFINDSCNLAKMSIDANNEKTNVSLLEFHYMKKGFKFYPVNVLFLLHMQLEVVKQEFYRSSDVQRTHEMIKTYVDKYQGIFGSESNLLSSVANLPNDLFETVSKKEFRFLVETMI